jgi:hypothetical protein
MEKKPSGRMTAPSRHSRNWVQGRLCIDRIIIVE